MAKERSQEKGGTGMQNLGSRLPQHSAFCTRCSPESGSPGLALPQGGTDGRLKLALELASTILLACPPKHLNLPVQFHERVVPDPHCTFNSEQSQQAT